MRTCPRIGDDDTVSRRPARHRGAPAARVRLHAPLSRDHRPHHRRRAASWPARCAERLAGRLSGRSPRSTRPRRRLASGRVARVLAPAAAGAGAQLRRLQRRRRRRNATPRPRWPPTAWPSARWPAPPADRRHAGALQHRLRLRPGRRPRAARRGRQRQAARRLRPVEAARRDLRPRSAALLRAARREPVRGVQRQEQRRQAGPGHPPRRSRAGVRRSHRDAELRPRRGRCHRRAGRSGQSPSACITA